MRHLTCGICGAEFTQSPGRGRTAKYCSSDCKRLAKNSKSAEWRKSGDVRQVRTCQGCGSQWCNIGGALGAAGPRKWCSSQCRINIRNGPDRFCACGSKLPKRHRTCASCKKKHRQELEARRSKRVWRWRCCLGCGTLYPIPRNQRHRKFCSLACSYAKSCCPIEYSSKGRVDLHPRSCVACKAVLFKPDVACPNHMPWKRAMWFAFNCVECGESVRVFYGDKRRKYCSDECAGRVERRQRPYKSDRDRALHYGVAYEHIDRDRVYARDGFVCMICGDRLDMGAHFNDPLAPTIDHILPISEGGPHLYANVQAAHRICNTEKGVTAVGSQLRLVG